MRSARSVNFGTNFYPLFDQSAISHQLGLLISHEGILHIPDAIASTQLLVSIELVAYVSAIHQSFNLTGDGPFALSCNRINTVELICPKLSS